MTVLAIDGSFTLHRAKNVCIKQVSDLHKQLIDAGKSEEYANKAADEELTDSRLCNVFFKMLPSKFEEFRATKGYVLWDEGRCSYRVALNNEYKIQRTQKPKTYVDRLADAAYKHARGYLHTTLPTIGVASLLIPGVEADDFAFYLSHTEPRGVLISDDKDWFLNLAPGWKLCRPMQKTKSQYVFDWSDFEDLTRCKDSKTNFGPRDIYLYEKALVGDKDEIPRVTTKVAATHIAEYLTGLRETLTAKERSVFETSKEIISRNIKLADTSWLISEPTIADMKSVMKTTNESVIVGDNTNFFHFAAYTGSLPYRDRWDRITAYLKYKD